MNTFARFAPFFVIFGLLVSCKENEIKNNRTESLSKDSIAQRPDSEISDTVLTTSNLNTFRNDYIPEFSSDSLFQMNHIVFPLKEKGYRREAGSEMDSYFEREIRREDWRLLDLRYDSSVYYSETDRYTQDFEKTGDSIKVIQRGIDNGIFFGYTFAKDSVWKLVEWWDYSN